MSKPIIIDCDPGHDDALAILLGAANDALELRAVTTVAGNQTIEKTTRNALQTLTLGERTDVPVAVGAGGPIVREQVIAENIHGETGLGGATLPEPAAEPVDDHAIDVIYERAHEEELTLVPTGPLTNVGLALRRYPELEDELDEIVLMGGAMSGGNVTPAAEFNIFADPEAARVVFESDVPVTMVGLDVTRQADLGGDGIERIRAKGTPLAETIADLLAFFRSTNDEQFEFESAPLHDPLAVAEVASPGILETEHVRVDVETNSDLTYGSTVVDILDVTDRPANAHVGVDVDRDAFLELLFDALEQY